MTDRERLKKIIDQSPAHFCDGCKESTEERAESIEMLADYLIASDVVEVRHGEWVSHIVGEAGSFDIYAHYCNECDFVYESGSEYGCKYCPNCGAKMDGERREG